MGGNRYTNAVLTVIAVALVIVAVRGLVPGAEAAGGSCGSAVMPCYVTAAPSEPVYVSNGPREPIFVQLVQ